LRQSARATDSRTLGDIHLHTRTWTQLKRLTRTDKNDGKFLSVCFCRSNFVSSCCRVKDRKVGEGTYAVVYQGEAAHTRRRVSLLTGIRSRGIYRPEGSHQEDKGRTIQRRTGYVCYPRSQVSTRTSPPKYHRGFQRPLLLFTFTCADRISFSFWTSSLQKRILTWCWSSWIATLR